jgi:hypothetical protein
MSTGSSRPLISVSMWPLHRLSIWSCGCLPVASISVGHSLTVYQNCAMIQKLANDLGGFRTTPGIPLLRIQISRVPECFPGKAAEGHPRAIFQFLPFLRQKP